MHEKGNYFIIRIVFFNATGDIKHDKYKPGDFFCNRLLKNDRYGLIQSNIFRGSQRNSLNKNPQIFTESQKT